jgi:prepilin-type processing-associated H-X9-DG protein
MANRVRCASNLRQIGQALEMYANDNGGRYPDDLGALLLTQDLTAEVFICPSSQGERAPGQTPQEQAQQLSDPLHMTYVYAGKGKSRPAAQPDAMILGYEHVEHHNCDGMNVLYADGHVEFQTAKVSAHVVAEIAAGHNPPRALK